MLDNTLETGVRTPMQAKHMLVTWERSFFAALRALRHLYFQLEYAKLELHSNCELCDEIRNSLALPNYRANKIQSDNDWQPLFILARDVLTHLYTKLDADSMTRLSVFSLKVAALQVPSVYAALVCCTNPFCKA
jgi:hypothetical protein